jgi:MFS family permease
MINVRNVAGRLQGDSLKVLELATVVFLWHAAIGIYFLSLVQQYLPQALHTGTAYPGYAMAAYGVAKFAWQPLAGWAADRLGRRTLMIAGLAVNLPVLLLMMEVPDERAFLGFSALLGIGAATMWPAFMAHVGEVIPHSRRARTLTLLNLANMIGIGAGTLAGVMLVDFVTYGSAFWLCIGFNVLVLGVVMRRLPETRHAVIVPIAEVAARARDATAWRPGMAMLAVTVLFLTIGTSLHTPMIGAYTRDVLQVKMSFLAMLFPLPALVAGVAMWKFGHLSDRFGRQVPLIGGLFVASLSLFALTLTRSPFIAVNLVVLAGLAYAVLIPAWGAAALDATDVGSRGLWLGALTAVQGLGTAGGQALGGLIGGVWGPLAPFKLAALMLMLAVALIATHHQWHQRSVGRGGGGRADEALPVPAAV